MRNRIILIFLIILALSIGLAWISTGYQTVQGWISFLVIQCLGIGIVLVGCWIVGSDPGRVSDHLQDQESKLPKAKYLTIMLPGWLGWLLVAAALLRLGAGVLWYVALPSLGYNSEVELAGYVMADAFERDTAAWELAKSEKPLSAAFIEYHNADQYGGMLFGSSLIYRYLGGSSHLPLQIVVLSASISALTVLFTWSFAKRVWDGAVAGIAAWIVALFPDAVLLGSSQMREAIMMSFAVIAFYGLVRVWQDRSLIGGLIMSAPIFFGFPLSPLFSLMLAGMLGGFALFLGVGSRLKNWRLWATLVGLVLLGLIVIAAFGEQILPGGASNPVELIQVWLKQAGRWQAYNAERASGWVQKIFRSTPAWMHAWLLLVYGVARPFLPAALFDSAARIWQGIAIWRSLGWALLLPFLILAPVVGWRRKGFWSSEMGLSIVVWVGILISSFRGGGDHWDNPRYRVVWIGFQAALAAWVWVSQRRDDSPWPRRVLIGMVLLLVWWIPWYLRRVTTLVWPIQDVFLTLGFGIISVLLYLVIDIWYSRNQKIGKTN